MELSLNGRNIHVEEPEILGSEKDLSLFFVHGAGCDASVWDPQAEYFSAGRLTYRMDLPGHGRSSSEPEESISAYAKWVRLVAFNLFPSRPFVLAGHSMGGAIAMEIAVDPPPGLAGIVLVGTGAKLAVAGAIFQMLKQDVETFFQTIGDFAFAPATPLEIRKRFIHTVRRCPRSVIYSDFRACDIFDIRDRIERILLPTLILCGAEDQLTPPKYSRYLQQNIHSSRLRIIPDAGHMVMAEQPAAMNHAVESFLGEIAANR
jgi:pimeloyl-ACP methyl ester carboxylesterase